MRRIYLHIAVAAALAIAWGLPGVAQATFPGKNGKIAYFGIYNGPNGELAGPHGIFLVNPDGSGRAKLTDNPSGNFSPSWSPDGKRIAFVGRDVFDSNLPFDIYVVNADGTGLVKLTNQGNNSEPAWSPDGTRLAFVRLLPTKSQIYVMNADGSDARNISSSGSSSSTSDNNPDWSPDGTKIAFTRQDPILQNVWIMNPDGSAKTKLTNTGPDGLDSGPSWSPDSQRIAFEHVVQDPNGSRFGTSFVYAMNRDGGGRTNLGPSGSNLLTPPAWSPDGRKIAFAVNFGSIHVLNIDDGADVNITPGSLLTDSPDWQAIRGPKRSDYKNAARFCKAEQAFWGDQFASRYGGGANAYGKCVSQNH